MVETRRWFAAPAAALRAICAGLSGAGASPWLEADFLFAAQRAALDRSPAGMPLIEAGSTRSGRAKVGSIGLPRQELNVLATASAAHNPEDETPKSHRHDPPPRRIVRKGRH
jgi:hypothetical protein